MILEVSSNQIRSVIWKHNVVLGSDLWCCVWAVEAEVVSLQDFVLGEGDGL